MATARHFRKLIAALPTRGRGQVEPFLAVLVAGVLAGAGPSQAQVLAPNLLYTSVQPCRLFDTRLAGGVLAAGTTRTFNVVGVSAVGSLDSQGGNHNGCPIPGFDLASMPQVQAVMLNFVAVGPSGPGDLRAWPTDQALPGSSVINYSNFNETVLNIANGIVVPVRQDMQGNDITLRADTSATHVLADVVGYFCSGSPVQSPGLANLALGTRAGNPGGASGASNTAIGVDALAFSTNGANNTAIGTRALELNTAGISNTAIGFQALVLNTTGGANVAVGEDALYHNSVGVGNVAVGNNALLKATTGNNSTALGYGALSNANSGGPNLAIGYNAGTNISVGTDNVDIANQAPGDESATIRIGATPQTKTFIAGIFGATSAGGTAVFVNSGGQLGTATSSLRFKEDVQDMGEASSALMQLRPVTFHYKAAYDDGSRLLQYGLVAEEVAQVYPDLVQYDQDGKPYTVRYQFVDAMLLNEVQKLRREMDVQRGQNEELRREVRELDSLRLQVERLTQLVKAQQEAAGLPRQ